MIALVILVALLGGAAAAVGAIVAGVCWCSRTMASRADGIDVLIEGNRYRYRVGMEAVDQGRIEQIGALRWAETMLAQRRLGGRREAHLLPWRRTGPKD